MALTNYEFAMRTARIAQRCASWSADTMSMGREALDQPTINDSAERFCREIKGMLDRLHPLSRDESGT